MKFSSPFHLVTFSPWPLLTSFSVFFLMMGFMKWMNLNSLNLMLLSLLILVFCLFQWWRDVIRESTFQGFHGYLIVKMLRFSFILFIISELFFFISFFWSFFHMMLSPPIELGNCWPPQGIIPFDPLGIPLVNSFILITSGMTVTLSHYSLLLENMNKSKNSLLLTIILGMIFTLFQLIEYNMSSFTMADSIYGSLFFMMTGFHGIHVLIGSIFLGCCYLRMLNNHFTFYHHVGFEMASWYWHFVDIVWLFLYIIVYWLST
uniref:Cytochrome c oxidase subunit 3 n=1 Tax=Auplopus sp. SJW-2017 TaxID=1940101 RepID=A0A1P8VH87_9HYME|nr:cytochrome c oxidase subunit 3 [Auplopus sp. SJW-2017]